LDEFEFAVREQGGLFVCYPMPRTDRVRVVFGHDGRLPNERGGRKERQDRRRSQDERATGAKKKLALKRIADDEHRKAPDFSIAGEGTAMAAGTPRNFWYAACLLSAE